MPSPRRIGYPPPPPPRQSPSGENVRERDHVGLGVAAVDAERVQLHQLARVVLVDTLELALGAGAAGRGVLPVVEVEEHRRMMRGRAEQRRGTCRSVCGRIASPRTRRSRIRSRPLPAKTLKWLNQNVGHHFLQLARPFDRAHHPRLDRLAHDDALLDAQLFGRILDRRLVGAAVRLRVFAREVERPLVLDEQRDWGHVQRAKRVDAIGEIGGNRNRLGMQLFVDVAFGSDRADVIEIAGARAEGEAVEHVQRAVLFRCVESHDRSLVYSTKPRGGGFTMLMTFREEVSFTTSPLTPLPSGRGKQTRRRR